MKIENIEDLKNAIQSILVKDYGDFKRKSVLYINRFFDLQGSLSETQQKVFHHLLWKIQFHPQGTIEETRQWTLNELEKLSPKGLS